jgi:hypothetical protein
VVPAGVSSPAAKLIERPSEDTEPDAG